MRLRDRPVEELPHALVLLGDQIYAHKPPYDTLDFIRSRRDTSRPPGEEVADFEEYARLYRDSWGDPAIRWLLSTVPSSMIFDDHEVSDDWNISASWVEETRIHPWWNDQIVGANASYWIYQHIGNLSPRELADNEIYQQVRGHQAAEEVIYPWAHRIDSSGAGTRWSFCRDFGRTRAVFVDARAGRVLEEDRRAIVDDEEWEWIVEHTEGDVDHLLICTTIPWLLSPAFNRLEAWNEALGDGAWGPLAAKASEKIRRELDFDHWAAFRESFHKLRKLLHEVACGERGRAPASVVVLSGDVHHAYLAEVAYPGSPDRAPVYQAVCSPYRNPLDEKERRVVRMGFTRTFTIFAALLARAAGADDPGVRWRTLEGPYFDNQVATLQIDRRTATMRLDKTVPGEDGKEALVESFSRRLA
jgi:hypothetical protein